MASRTALPLLLVSAALAWIPGSATANPCALEGSLQTQPIPAAEWAGSSETRVAGDETDGLGGTGLGDEPEGLGGTGRGPRERLAGSDETDGLGGTGLGDEPEGLGGTGVFGIVTGFGSICVNGVRIAYGPETPTEINGSPGSAASLRVGDVVAVQSHAVSGELHANAIAVRQMVRGQVQGLTVADRRLQVLGQSVELPEAWAGDALAALRVGQAVAVSGQRRSDGRIVATRLTILDALAEASLIGMLEIDGAGQARVAGLPLAPATVVDRALEGDTVLVRGAWRPGLEQLDEVRLELAVAFDPGTRAVSLGGYVQSRTGEMARIGGLRVELDDVLHQRLQLDRYAVVRGTLTPSGAIRALRLGLDVRPPRQRPPKPLVPSGIDHPTTVDRPVDQFHPKRTIKIDRIKPLPKPLPKPLARPAPTSVLP